MGINNMLEWIEKQWGKESTNYINVSEKLEKLGKYQY